MTCGPTEEIVREMFRGDSFIFDVQVFQNDGCTPQNISGWTVWFTAKRYISDADSQAVVQLGTALPLTGIVLTAPTNGEAEVTIPPFATSRFPDSPTTLVYDVQVKDPLTSRVFTVEIGRLIVRPDVTRAIA